MSSNLMPRPSQDSRPLLVLAAWLENTHHRNDKVVSFPANTSDAIIHARPRGAQYNMQEVQAIVLALEGRDSALCERLDSLSLTILCSIFIYSQQCLAQQRGLCLLAGALHQTKRETALEAAQKQRSKIVIGQAALTLLIKGFLKHDASDKLRRWLGILALELLEGCPENTEKLRSDPPGERYWQHLGEVIKHGSCQVLKLLAGSMIREMVSLGVSSDDFWQCGTSSDLYSKFPKGRHHNSQWVTSFEEFVDELVLEKILTQEISSVMFAHALYLGDRKWNLEDEADILVTLSEELNIVVPANAAGPAVYIDVPLEFIYEVSSDNALVPDSQQSTYGLVIHLAGGAIPNCFLNATGYVERYVILGFSSEKVAVALKRLLMSTSLRLNRFLSHSRLGATDASEHVSSDDELAAPGPMLSGGQMLMRTASLANSIVPNSNAVRTIDPSKLQRSHSSQRASPEHEEAMSNMMVEHDEETQLIDRSVEMAAEGIDVSENEVLVEQSIEGIDVSGNDGSSSRETQYQNKQAHVPGNITPNVRFRYSQCLSKGKQERIEQRDRNSGMRLSAIQNVPESRTRPYKQTISPIKQVKDRKSPNNLDGDHDDLYYASPKIIGGRRRSPRLLARENTPKQGERPTETAVRQPSVKTDLPNKLSRQLRNADGVVESYTEHPTDNISTLMKNGAGDVGTNVDSKKGKAPSPVKSGIVMKESSRPPVKAAKRKGKPAVTKEPPDASFKNHDLLSSPQRADLTIQTSEKTKATSIQSKPMKASRKKQAKAKPLPRKPVSMASSEGSASKLGKGLKNKATANGLARGTIPHRPGGKKIEGNDDAIWDVDQALSEAESQTFKQSRRPVKTAKKQDAHVLKMENNKIETQLYPDRAKANKSSRAKNKDSVAGLVKTKPPPAALSQPRPRRAAAIKANKKIQGLEESDEIVDDEEVMPTLTRSKRKTHFITAKMPKDPRDSGGNGKSYSRKLPTPKLSTIDFIPDSVSPDSSDKQRPDPVLDPKANSSSEKDTLVRDAPAEDFRAAAGSKGEKLQKESKTSLKIIRLGHSNDLDKRDSTPAEQGARSAEAKVDLILDSVPHLRESILEPKPAPLSSEQEKHVKQGLDKLDAKKLSDVEDQVDDAAVSAPNDDESHGLNSNSGIVAEEVTHPQVPTTTMAVEVREKRTSPRLAEAAKNPSTTPQVPTNVKVRERRTSPRLAEAAKKSLVSPTAPTAPMTVEIRERRASPRSAENAKEVSPKSSTSTRLDPSVAKLNASILQLKETNAKIKSSEVLGDVNGQSKRPGISKSPDLERPLREPKAAELDTLGNTTLEDAKQADKAPRLLTSAVRIDGEGGRSLTPSKKAAGDAVSASAVKAKRKNEQLGDTSNKRVRMALRERLENASAKRKPAHDLKKTPPLAVSNKPLVIGFSSTGPRNQGTVSARKSKPVGNAESGTPSAAEMRKHEVANHNTHHVGAGFASEEEARELPPEDIQHRVKFTGGAQKEVCDLPLRNQAEHIKVVNAVVNGDTYIQQHGSEKRKLAPFLNEPAPWEQEQLSKRQKRDIKTPPAAQNPYPKMLPDIGTNLIHDRSHRLSSQNTRVKENGSPMPFFITGDEYIAAEEQYSDEDDGRHALAEARLEEQFVLQDDNLILPERFVPLPPLVPTASVSRPKPTACQNLSNNSKQVPSSPHASSAFGAMPPHHLYHDGEIVNLETKETIVPTKPQDPFLGAAHNPQNSFMNALRKSTEFAAKKINQKSGGVVMRKSPNVGEDPDKTLVEPALRKRYRKVNVLDDSPSSQSGSSTQASQPNESSEEESDVETEEAKWRKGLEPHQDNMLQCLLTISHRLIRHLVDKETAVRDMVTDFGNHGSRLVESYEKALQEQIEIQRANDDQRHQDLIKTLQKAQADRSSTSKAVVEWRVQDMQAQWEKQQEALMKRMSAALEACAE